MERQFLDITWSSILKVVATLSALYFVFLVHDILLLTVFGLVIAILFEWPVRRLARYIPRPLATFFLYAVVLGTISFLFYLPISTLVVEVKEFVRLLPVYFEQVSPSLSKIGFEAFDDLQSFTEALESLSDAISSNILNALFYVFGGVASTGYVLSVSLFLVLEGRKIQDGLKLLFDKQDEKVVTAMWLNSERKVALWFLRIIVGSVFLGALSYASFLILDVKYPLSLGLIGGLANFVPIVGPAVATLILFFMIAMDSVSKAVLAVLIYIVLQQIENNVIGPLLIKKFTGLSPTLIIISLTIGARLAGALGAFLMIPLVGVIMEFLKAFLERKKEQKVEID